MKKQNNKFSNYLEQIQTVFENDEYERFYEEPMDSEDDYVVKNSEKDGVPSLKKKMNLYFKQEMKTIKEDLQEITEEYSVDVLKEFLEDVQYEETWQAKLLQEIFDL